jgi:hypothetical protein
MALKRHGLSIGIERVNNEFFLTLTATGKLTHEDYEIITPMLESALKGVQDPHITALVDAREMEGWDLHAAWDDFKLGVTHKRKFKRLAIVGNKKWQEMATKLGSWFIHGESEYFETMDAALDWLSQSSDSGQSSADERRLGSRRQKPEERRQESGDRRLDAENRRQNAADRRQE